MTFSADELEIIPSERDIRVVDILGRERRLMMDYLSGIVYSFFETKLAESADAFRICASGLLPSGRIVKSSREFLHNDAPPTDPRLSPSPKCVEDFRPSPYNTSSPAFDRAAGAWGNKRGKEDRILTVPLSDAAIKS